MSTDCLEALHCPGTMPTGHSYGSIQTRTYSTPTGRTRIRTGWCCGRRKSSAADHIVAAITGIMTTHLHILLLASVLVCASCRHASPELEAVRSGRQLNTGTLSTEDEITAELREWFDPLLQRSFPGWVRTAPLVFDDLFWRLHADKREQWRNPYSHGADVVSESMVGGE